MKNSPWRRLFAGLHRSTSADENTSTPSVPEPDEPAQPVRYRLTRKLGGGAMGEVWLAHDTLLDRQVAIKYLKATQDARNKELFLSEARILAQIHHPNITLIYDAVFDEQRNGFYLVMEYVEGESLAHRLAGQAEPLSFDLLLDVAVGVLQALKYAHSKGIVHRDIKPANVMLPPAGGVKLTDFGVASLMSLLAEGSFLVVGTPAYMSPEQIEGQPLDGRADLYSLGIMLYELATGGQQPFGGSNTVALFQAHLNTPPPELSRFTTDIPLAFERVILRLLAKNPADRYPSAEVALKVIQSIQARQQFSRPHFNLLEAGTQPLFGRAGEMARLVELWTDIQNSGRPRLVILQGETGIGKSRLAAEFLGREVIDRGFVAVAGLGGEANQPYASWAEILATLIQQGCGASLTPAQLDQLCDAVPGLARLLNIDRPAASQAAPPPPSPLGGGLWQALSSRMSSLAADEPSPAQEELFNTTLALLTGLGPAAVLLEGAGTLDESSQALLRFLLRQSQLSLLLLAACPPAARPWYGTFSADEKTVINLAPLPVPDAEATMVHRLGGPVSAAVATAIMTATGGNPRRMEETIGRMVETREILRDAAGEWHYPAREIEATADAVLTKRVLGVFARQLGQLSPDSRDLLTLAALVQPGGEFTIETWLMIVGDEDRRELARQVLAEALQKRLLREAGEGRYTFRPADLAAALVSALPDTRRRHLHRQAAEALREGQGDPALIKYHEEQAG